MRASTLANRIATLALTKKASDVLTMDLRGISSVADFFVVCSGDSEIQVKAIADAVEEGVEKDGALLWHRESGSATWVVLDYVDVVAHIFHKTTRSFYNLEKLWGDAKITSVVETPKARHSGERTAAKRTAPAGRRSGVKAAPVRSEKVRTRTGR